MGKESRARRERREGGDPVDRVWADYTAAFKQDVLAPLLQSRMMVCLWDRDLDPDTQRIKLATQIGLMLCWGKPLLLVVPPGLVLPPGLARAADEIVTDFDPRDPDAQDRMAAATRRMRERVDAEGGDGDDA